MEIHRKNLPAYLEKRGIEVFKIDTNELSLEEVADVAVAKIEAIKNEK